MHQPIGFYLGDREDPQRRADVAVVMPSSLRPEAARALRSVFAQDFDGRIQVMLGVDRSDQSDSAITGLFDQRPANVSACVVRLPYSTSLQYGGVHSAGHGGALRSILSFMANSRRVTYLDDDNEWLPSHLSDLVKALQDNAWAHSHRTLVDRDSGRELGVDRHESAGVDQGRFKDQGGFVDPACLMIDKVKLVRALDRWSVAVPVQVDEQAGKVRLGEADRHLFRSIRTWPHGVEPGPTVRRYVAAEDPLRRQFDAKAGQAAP